MKSRTDSPKAFNTKLSLIAIAVASCCAYPAMAQNIHYQDGGEHSIEDVKTAVSFYVQKKTTVTAKNIEVTGSSQQQRVGVQGGSTLNAGSIVTQGLLVDGASTIKTGSLTLTSGGEVNDNSKLIISDGIFKSTGVNRVYIRSGSKLLKDEKGTALDKIEINSVLESEVDIQAGSFKGAYVGKKGVVFNVANNVDLTGTVDLQEGAQLIAGGDITYGNGNNAVSNTSKGTIKAGGNIVLNGTAFFGGESSDLEVYADKFILNNGGQQIYGNVHANEVVADGITNSNFWNGLNIEKVTLKNSERGNLQVGASSKIGTLIVEKGSTNTFETYTKSSDTKTKIEVASLVVEDGATLGLTVTGASADVIGSHEFEVGNVLLGDGASLGNTRRDNSDRKIGYKNLYVGSLEASGNAKLDLDYGVTHVDSFVVHENATLTVGSSGLVPEEVSVGVLSGKDKPLTVTLGDKSSLKLNSATTETTKLAVQTNANKVGTVELGEKSTLEAAQVSVTGLDSGATGNLNKDLAALAQVVQKDGKGIAGVAVIQQATDILDGGSAITTANGGLSQVKVTANSNINGIVEMTAVGLHIWRNEINDMNKRLGELRDSSDDANGVWARVYNGKAKFGDQKITNKYTAFQFGYDRQVADGLWLGGALSWTDGDSDFAVGGGDNSLMALTAYGSKLWDNGMFVDVTGKFGRIKNEFDISLTNGRSSADYDANVVSVSAEAGWRVYPLNNGFFVEPQVEMMYGRVESVDYTTSTGVKVNQDSAETLIGRAGFVMGLKCPSDRGNAYVRASVLHDWEGDANFKFSKDGVNSRAISESLGGTWYEYGIGANFNATKQLHIYADLEAANGGEVDTDYRVNLGMRYSF